MCAQSTGISFLAARALALSRGADDRAPRARGASAGRAVSSQRRGRATRRRGRRVQRVVRKNALRVEQRVDQRLIGLVARPEHVVLEPLLRVRESASEIDVHVGRVHQRRRARRQATAPRPWRTTAGRSLPQTACASSCRDARADREGCLGAAWPGAPANSLARGIRAFSPASNNRNTRSTAT